MGESKLDASCKAVDKFAAPHFMGIDHFPDGMIEEDQLLINADSRFVLVSLDVSFDLLYFLKVFLSLIRS